MKPFSLNIPITKVDEEQRIVYGYATVEELDRQGDIVDYEASKKAFGKWAGNIREQHDAKKAVGKRVHTEFDDDAKKVLIGAYISKSEDGENAWTKVKEGILTGFSIGGKIYKTIRETVKGEDGSTVNANRILDYDLSEVSLVDVPACPSAQFVMVKSVDGMTQEVEEMHESQNETLPWFMKSFAYAPEQVNQIQKASDNEGMEKRDYSEKEREEMAESGEALPDGSFPIKTVADLKNAIKAYGRAKDQAKAKAHIIKRAKALGKTDLLPEDWNVKGVESEMEKADEIAKENVETPTEEVVEKANVIGGEERDAEGKPVEEAKEEKPKTVKKGLYTVADLAQCVENLQYIVQSAEFEAQYEGDNSEVPAKLRAAVAQVGECLVAMTQEEVAEANGGEDVEVEDVELADRPTDLQKSVETMVTESLKANQSDMLKALADIVAGKVAEVIKPLEDRINAVESKPASAAPVRAYTVVDKVADSKDESKEDELLAKAADMEAHPERYSLTDRTTLAAELFKRSSRQRPILMNKEA